MDLRRCASHRLISKDSENQLINLIQLGTFGDSTFSGRKQIKKYLKCSQPHRNSPRKAEVTYHRLKTLIVRRYYDVTDDVRAMWMPMFRLSIEVLSLLHVIATLDSQSEIR